jgi:ATP-dependent DNA helicase RecQ
LDQKYKLLKQHFGYDEFREGQETLIDSILNGTDTLGIMPTGAGKSICFQIPALMFKGITLVISPLISLMKDQVSALNQAGIHAAFLNSSLTNAPL